MHLRALCLLSLLCLACLAAAPERAEAPLTSSGRRRRDRSAASFGSG
jgi:hypothetical protein